MQANPGLKRAICAKLPQKGPEFFKPPTYHSALLQITPKMRLTIALFQSTPEGCAGT